jgi:hypothetical protein
MACGLVTAAVALAVTSGASAQTASEFKTLKIVVGFSTGGGYDTYARVLARHMGRHLSGTPGIIVQNMPARADPRPTGPCSVRGRTRDDTGGQGRSRHPDDDGRARPPLYCVRAGSGRPPRKAFDATMKDAQFLAEAEKLDLPVAGPISGLEAEKIISSFYAASPALIARTQAIVGK